MKILLIIPDCNPQWPSVPLVGYHFYHHIKKQVKVTLATHGRNQAALEERHSGEDILYFRESRLSGFYYRWLLQIGMTRWANWPLQHMLMYPFYAEFNYKVDACFKQKAAAGSFDVVHALTPILPRYPVKLISSCRQTPFILGPVNGGLPYPKSFGQIARKEKSLFNFLRVFSRLIPGYAKTYTSADKVLCGSSYTLAMLREMFPRAAHKMALFAENGIHKSFFSARAVKKKSGPFRLLFVGRLVPYKGVDMILAAVSMLHKGSAGQIRLTVVGDGVERGRLEQMAKALHIDSIVRFTGWVSQAETIGYYSTSDVFCFPSVREFGGAVVLEAMASGLPCMVVNHGGISEYVTEACGIKIQPISRRHIVEEMKNGILRLMNDRDLCQALSVKSVERAECYEWENKATKIVALYHNLQETHRAK